MAQLAISTTKSAYNAGFAAREACLPEKSCPFPIARKAEYAAWRMGWSQACREYRELIISEASISQYISQQEIDALYKKYADSDMLAVIETNLQKWANARRAAKASEAWLDNTRADPIALLLWNAPARKGRVAGQFRKTKWKSGFRAGSSVKTAGSRSLAI